MLHAPATLCVHVMITRQRISWLLLSLARFCIVLVSVSAFWIPPGLLPCRNICHQGQPFVQQVGVKPTRFPPLFLSATRFRGNLSSVIFSKRSHLGQWEDEIGVQERMPNTTEEQHRQAVVQKFLDIQDAEFKEERRKVRWGDFYLARNRADIFDIEKQQRQRIAAEHQQILDFATQRGITMQMIDPQITNEDLMGKIVEIKVYPVAKFKPWYHAMDQDLEKEWEQIENPTSCDVETLPPTNTVHLDGVVTSREALRGFRITRKGGSTLDLNPGDYVVHQKFGIGRFQGFAIVSGRKLSAAEQAMRQKEKWDELVSHHNTLLPGKTIAPLEPEKKTEESEEVVEPGSEPSPKRLVMEIMYMRTLIQVPIERVHRIARFRSGGSKVKPKVSNLKRMHWKKVTETVREKTTEQARSVLALYASRETRKRKPFDPTLESQVDKFGESFEFDPSPDQKQCFEDVQNDMVWRVRPMDRLVCGDVGFGKTEVALRAIYRAIANGKQAAFLAPTTVLAAQHFRKALKRMGEGTQFGLRIGYLRKGMPTKQGNLFREKIANGEFDLIVGTHSLLGKNVVFKDLGLLVVDEEQRFGVAQKEKLKVFHETVDVLTLSATPIPRTLQMSLSGIRDTSAIRTPPPLRKPVLSIIDQYSAHFVKEAISRELVRGGQMFYVVPHVRMLKGTEKTLKDLFPNLRIVIAHGQMRRCIAEKAVSDFAEGEYDLLLATTIIENGVDIPRVNTIIVQDCQRFGLSTLYQLRGRVGRSDQQAYAYMLHTNKTMTIEASLRLQAIGELSHLGAGIDVANRDLEIRGAGALLGTEQSGSAASVGFDLYMKMLKESIRELRGLDLTPVPRTNVILPKGAGSMHVQNTTESGVLTVSTISFPESYIPDKAERESWELQARLADSTNSLVNLTATLKEKYGPIPRSMQAAFKTLHLHACTRRLGVDLVGLVNIPTSNRTDCVLRAPGLRPRHLEMIVPLLKNGILPIGLDVVIPHNFTRNGADEVVIGGQEFKLGKDPENDDDDDIDDLEMEAARESSSVYSVTNMTEVDIRKYPRFLVRNFNETSHIDGLLRLLIPVSKVIVTQQERYYRAAKTAAEASERARKGKREKKIY
eukprot:Nitzschia sp. Nitz4//scaffold86_size83305//57770//61093//NITZ4_005268-RA/size83305-exonerate_est2genome-gene-0.40-mRNA-1//1//CDS//3329559268//3368//frame0